MAGIHDRVKTIDTSNEKLNNYTRWAYDLKKSVKNGIALVSSDEAYEIYKDKRNKGEFRCPKCGNEVYLTTDRGKNVFRHYKINGSPLVESDGPIHKIVKDKIALDGVVIPAIKLGDLQSRVGNNFEVNPKYKDLIIRDGKIELLRNVVMECRIDGLPRIGDVVGTINNERYIIEVTHTHGLTEDKIEELRGTGANVIEVVVHTTDGLIDKLDYNWVVNDNIVRALYQLVWRFCKHSIVKEPISYNQNGMLEYIVPCKRKMQDEHARLCNSDEPYGRTYDKIHKCTCNYKVDCAGCPRYFGVDHDKNGKDIVQCLLVDKDDGSLSTIATIPKLVKELQDKLKKV